MIYRHNFGAQTDPTGSSGAQRAIGSTTKKHGHTDPSLTIAATLVIGFCAGPVLSEPMSREDRVVHLSARHFLALSAEEFQKLAPKLIVSPLISGGHDAVDVAARLHSLGFEGRYRVLAEHIPNLQMIAHEVRQSAPALDVSVARIAT